MARKIIDVAMRQRVLDLYAAGASLSEISADANISTGGEPL
jgi:hypothetical protein